MAGTAPVFICILFLLLHHSAEVCTGDVTGIAAQPARFDVGLRGNILGLALGQDLIGDFQRDTGVRDVDVDDVTFLTRPMGPPEAASGLT